MKVELVLMSDYLGQPFLDQVLSSGPGASAEHGNN